MVLVTLAGASLVGLAGKGEPALSAMASTPMKDNMELRLLWLAIAVLAALIVGLVAGALSFIDDRRVAAAIMRGGAAFGATIASLVGIYAFLS